MTTVTLKPKGFAYNSRNAMNDDKWGDVISEIRLDESLPEESLAGIEGFSHAEIIFYFDQAAEEKEILMTRHPRGNKAWPKVGIFAQRNKDRPNHLGLTIVSIIKREGRTLFVKGLDAIGGTPVLDIKPVFAEFLPRGAVRQPQWSHELVKEYWENNC